jgi:hypothetical protein
MLQRIINVGAPKICPEILNERNRLFRGGFCVRNAVFSIDYHHLEFGAKGADLEMGSLRQTAKE